MSSNTEMLIASVPPGTPRKRNVYDVIKELQSRDSSKKPNILVRVDYNVPMDKVTKQITDDSRIRGSLPTIQTILAANCNVILCSHMGRPKLVQAGNMDDEATIQEKQNLSLEPIAKHLSTLLENRTVLFAPDCLDASDTIAQLSTGADDGNADICLLENLRFYKMEEKNDIETFATKLASYGDAYINDAFGTCHRAHASTAGVPSLLNPNVCGIGILVASELQYLDFKASSSSGSEESPKIAAVIGGSKVSTKLPVIKGLLESIDVLLLCGGLAFTFLKAMDIPIGNSLVEDSMVDIAKQFIEQAKSSNKQLVVPIDAVCTTSFPSGPMNIDDTITVDTIPNGTGGIPDGYMGLDAGPKTVALFLETLQSYNVTKCIMNGPLGVFEIAPFDIGTRTFIDGIEQMTKNNQLVSVVGGGDTVAALEQFHKTDAVSYVSTGGGATLELLAGDLLPGVEAIETITD